MTPLKEPTEAQFLAAQAFAQAVMSCLAGKRGIHAETAISMAARLAGTFYFRSFGFNLKAKPGTAVLSQEANEIGSVLMGYFSGGLQYLDMQLDESKLHFEIPEEHQPGYDITHMQRLLEGNLRLIADEHGLSDVEAGQAGALSAAILVHMTAEALDPHIGFAIAALGFVEGTKTMPPPLDSGSRKPGREPRMGSHYPARKKPWYQFW